MDNKINRINFPYTENKVDIFTEHENNYLLTVAGIPSYLASYEDLQKINPQSDFNRYGWVLAFNKRYAVIDKDDIIYVNPDFDKQYKPIINCNYSFFRYLLYTDITYTHRTIDIYDKNISVSDVLNKVIQTAINLSIELNERVVIFQSLEFFDRH